MKAVTIFIAFAAMSGLTSACGGTTATTSSPTPTIREVTKEDLAVMPLPHSQLGSDFSNLPVDSDSGYQTSTFVADNTLDPADTAASVENAGWVASYLLDFTDPSYAAFNTGQGLVGGDSELDLFKDGPSADAFLTKQLGDAQTFTGKTVQHGATLVHSTRFDVSAGDAGYGLSEEVTLNGIDAHGWIAGFRLGNLIASVQMTRGDANDMTSTMVQLVRILETRVMGVLDGTVNDTPVPLPSATPMNSP